MNRLLMEGKTVIVSGASYGMGKEMAAVLAAEGANVLMTARGKEKLNAAVEEIRAAGGNAVGMTMDSSKAEDILTKPLLFGRIWMT